MRNNIGIRPRDTTLKHAEVNTKRISSISWNKLCKIVNPPLLAFPEVAVRDFKYQPIPSTDKFMFIDLSLRPQISAKISVLIG